MIEDKVGLKRQTEVRESVYGSSFGLSDRLVLVRGFGFVK